MFLYRVLAIGLAVFLVAGIGSLFYAFNHCEKGMEGDELPLKSLRNRSELRSLAEKMRSGQMKPAETKAYVELGGSLQKYNSYDLLKNFFVAPHDGSILNYFIAGKHSLGSIPTPPNHHQSLKMLLEAGADPNLQGTNNMDWLSMPPLIFAASGDDLESIKLLVEQGADVHATFKGYVRDYTALSVTDNNETKALLKSLGAQK